jgi:hypothetical protein
MGVCCRGRRKGARLPSQARANPWLAALTIDHPVTALGTRTAKSLPPHCDLFPNLKKKFFHFSKKNSPGRRVDGPHHRRHLRKSKQSYRAIRKRQLME